MARRGGDDRVPADPFAAVREETLAHLRRHGCGCYPYYDGSFLGTVAAAIRARRILELGTALGYSALWFAHGAREAEVDTIEGDAAHVALARANIERAGLAARVRVHHGDFDAILAGLAGGYDLAFFDGHAPTEKLVKRLNDLLRPQGVLIATNLDFEAGSGRIGALMADPSRFVTTFAAEDGRTALAVKRE